MDDALKMMQELTTAAKPAFEYKLRGLDGSMTITDRGIVIARSGIFGLANHGMAGAKFYPYTQLGSVQFRKGWFKGWFQLSPTGGNSERANGRNGNLRDENTFCFSSTQNKEAQIVNDYIQTKIESLN